MPARQCSQSCQIELPRSLGHGSGGVTRPLTAMVAAAAREKTAPQGRSAAGPLTGAEERR